MSARQRFDGRMWDVDKILTVLGIHFGEVDGFGHAMHAAWRIRTLIAVQREYHVARQGSPKYGLDWKKNLKKEIKEFLKTQQLPYSAMRDGIAAIRTAELTTWAQSGQPVATIKNDRRNVAILRSIAHER